MKNKIYFVPFLIILLISSKSIFPQGPGEPYHPMTANGAKGIWPGHILNWKNPPATIYNRIYFSENDSLVNSMDSSVLIYDGYPSIVYSSASLGVVGTLDYYKKYYWRVVEYDSIDFTSGPTWYFISRGHSTNYIWEDFNNGLNNWQILGPGGTTNWSVQNTSYSGGSPPELCFSWTPSFNNLSYIMYNTEVYGNLWYSFQHYVDWYATPFTVGFAATTNSGSSWTTIWEISPQGNVGPEIVSGLIDGFSEEYKVGFYYSGNSFNVDYWYLDNIGVDGPLTQPTPPNYLEAVADTGQHKVYLSWNPGWCISYLADEYEIKRKDGLPLDTASYSLLTTISGSILSFIDETVLRNKIYTYKIRALCGSYPTIWGNEATAYVSDIVTFAENGVDQPQEFYLSQNYPNPFNPSTKIKFTLTQSLFLGERVSEGRVRAVLKIYDVLGNELATLVNEEKSAGTYEVEFDATGLPSGVYFYTLQAALFIQTKKMLLLK